MPLSAPVRAGLVTTATLTLALMATAPAFAADDTVLPKIGDQCNADTVVPVGLICDAGGLLALPDDAPDPTPTTDPPADAGSGDTPAPIVVVPDPTLPGAIPPVGGSTNPAGGADSGAGGTKTPPASGGAPTGQPGTSNSSKQTGATLHNAATGKDTTAPGKSLLTAATVSTLASSDLPSLGAMRSLPLRPGTAGLPLSAYTPSPLLANLPGGQALAAVQAPLLAVGNDAADGGGFTLASLSSKALPGLLVVLATALVAAVAAANLRAFQDRFPQWRR
jgi:hypothetical protein